MEQSHSALLCWVLHHGSSHSSFPFFDRTGQLLISQPLFKSIMVVVGDGRRSAACGGVSSYRRLARVERPWISRLITIDR